MPLQEEEIKEAVQTEVIPGIIFEDSRTRIRSNTLHELAHTHPASWWKCMRVKDSKSFDII